MTAKGSIPLPWAKAGHGVPDDIVKLFTMWDSTLGRLHPFFSAPPPCPPRPEKAFRLIQPGAPSQRNEQPLATARRDRPPTPPDPLPINTTTYHIDLYGNADSPDQAARDARPPSPPSCCSARRPTRRRRGGARLACRRQPRPGRQGAEQRLASHVGSELPQASTGAPNRLPRVVLAAAHGLDVAPLFASRFAAPPEARELSRFDPRPPAARRWRRPGRRGLPPIVVVRRSLRRRDARTVAPRGSARLQTAPTP